MQAKNDSQVSHNENNESKEPAVTVKKQATAQQTTSNTVKEEQESKQVVTKSQENNNTSTATKQVKNNETSATIANADNVKSVVWTNKPDTSKTGAGTDSATVTFNDGSTVTIKGSYVVNSIDATDLSKAIKDGQDAQKTTKYTNGSDKAKKDLDDALNKGIKDINNPDLSQDQADKDAKDIEDAIKKLDGKATDTTNLDKAIKDGKDAQKTVHYDNSSDKANESELPQTGESSNTIALASGIATALTAGIGMLAEGKKRKRE